MWLVHMSLVTCLSVPWLPINIPYKKDIIFYSCYYKVNPLLTASIIRTESNFNPRAKKYEWRVKDYSAGLMQIRYQTARMLGYKGKLKYLYKPRTNISLGVQYLKQLITRYPVNNDAIIAYNQGTPIWSNKKHSYITRSGKKNPYANKVVFHIKQFEVLDASSGE